MLSGNMHVVDDQHCTFFFFLPHFSTVSALAAALASVCFLSFFSFFLAFVCVFFFYFFFFLLLLVCQFDDILSRCWLENAVIIAHFQRKVNLRVKVM